MVDIDIIEIMERSDNASAFPISRKEGKGTRSPDDCASSPSHRKSILKTGEHDHVEVDSADSSSCSSSSSSSSSAGSKRSGADSRGGEIIDSGEESSADSSDNDNDNDSESTRSNGNSGAAIMSNYGKENIGIEEGVAFSSASSLFFSNIAKGNPKTGCNLDPNGPAQSSNTARPLHQRNQHPTHQTMPRQSRSRSEAIVNPYKRTAAVNPYKKNSNTRYLASTAVNPYNTSSSSSPLPSYTITSPVPPSRQSRGVGNSKSRFPASRSMDLLSASMGGANIDFGDLPIQANTADKPMPTPTVTRTTTSIAHGSSSEKQLEQHTPFIDPLLYKPPPFQTKPDPIVHNMTIHTCPKHSRRMIPVNQVFSSPVSKFWTSKFHSFNHMQSELTNTMANSDDNVVVSAPTGGGKTAIFEMAMGRLFAGYKMNQTSEIPKSRKVVYISPSKALCDERYNDWKMRLAHIDTSIECAVVTGDAVGNASFREIDDAHLILTTPEKWDAITRKWTDHLSLIGAVKLLLIDEVHLIGDDSRGGCLEAVISRMKTVQRAAKAKYNMMTRDVPNDEYRDSLGIDMRIVCVSATLPNISDIAAFVDAREAYNFDSSYRPVPLTTHVVGLGYIGKNIYMFDKNLGKEVPGLLRRFSCGKPSIIFCHTKKQTEALALELISAYGSQNAESIQVSKNTNLNSLRKCLERGIAYHHAGMEADNRHLVEKAFSRGIITCLCATSTLAMGVNLPAHLVIIKGTQVWRGPGQGYKDIDSGTLLQMTGRAGRPGFDTSGTAVIMTDKNSKSSYERMSTGLQVVESKLLKNLVETLNTEVSQNVINTVEEAIDWLKGTFFFCRVRKNSSHYGLVKKCEQEQEKYLMNKCMESLQNLHSLGIIDVSDNGNHIAPKKASHVMSRHLVPFHAMKLIIEIPHDPGPLHILQILSGMEGLHFPVRKAEKKKLNEAHKMIKYKLEGTPSKIRIQTPFQKAFVLLQSAIGQIFLDDYTLRQEMSMTVEYASRMLSAAEDFSKEESNNGQVALECMLMRRCLATSLWSSNDGILNQILGVGQKTASRLSMNGVRNFDDILSKSMNEIEQACGRKSPFGQNLRSAASKIISGRLSLSGHLEEMNSKDDVPILVCEVSRENEAFMPGDQDSTIVKYTLAIYTDRAGGALIFRSDLSGRSSHRIVCPCKFGRIYIRLVSNIVGLDSSLIIDGNDTVKKSHFSLTPPSKKKVTKKKQSTSTNSSARINSTDTMNHMVTGVDDLRVQKRKPTDVNARTPSTANKSSFFQRVVKESKLNQSIVTPSSSMHDGTITGQHNNTTPTSRSRSLSKEESGRGHVQAHTYDMDNVFSREPKRIRTQKRSWQRQKKEQKALQQRAFGSPKENPFSSFKFDPNECEKELEKSCKNTVPKYCTPTNTIPLKTRSIIPASAPTPIRNRSPVINHVHRRSRFLALARKKSSPSVGSHLKIQRQELLWQKAQEQEAYAREFVKPNSYHCTKTLPSQDGNLQNVMQSFDFDESRMNPELEYQLRIARYNEHNESFQDHYNEAFQHQQSMEGQTDHWTRGTGPVQTQTQALTRPHSHYNNHSMVCDPYYRDNLNVQSEEQFQYQDILPESFGDPFASNFPKEGPSFSCKESVYPDYLIENICQPFGQQFDDSLHPMIQAQEVSYEKEQMIPEGMIITVEGERNEDRVNADFENAFFG